MIPSPPSDCVAQNGLHYTWLRCQFQCADNLMQQYGARMQIKLYAHIILTEQFFPFFLVDPLNQNSGLSKDCH